MVLYCRNMTTPCDSSLPAETSCNLQHPDDDKDRQDCSCSFGSVMMLGIAVTQNEQNQSYRSLTPELTDIWHSCLHAIAL